MTRIIDGLDRESLINDDSFLGTREITLQIKKKGHSNMTCLINGAYHFLTLHRPAIYTANVDYNVMEETVLQLWMQVRNIGNRYVKEHITKLDPQPPTWTDLADKKYHVAAFERIIYLWSRVDDGVAPVDILDPKHNNLIPLHLFENGWGAEEVLKAVINNHRSTYSKSQKVRIYSFNFMK
jgi:hypothetical protein